MEDDADGCRSGPSTARMLWLQQQLPRRQRTKGRPSRSSVIRRLSGAKQKQRQTRTRTPETRAALDARQWSRAAPAACKASDARSRERPKDDRFQGGSLLGTDTRSLEARTPASNGSLWGTPSARADAWGDGAGAAGDGGACARAFAGAGGADDAARGAGAFGDGDGRWSASKSNVEESEEGTACPWVFGWSYPNGRRA